MPGRAWKHRSSNVWLIAAIGLAGVACLGITLVIFLFAYTQIHSPGAGSQAGSGVQPEGGPAEWLSWLDEWTLPPTALAGIQITQSPTLSPTVTFTPFQPRTYTPIPSPTVTATLTPTPTETRTPTPTPTETSTATSTETPADTPTAIRLPTETPTETLKAIPQPTEPPPVDNAGIPPEASVSGVTGYAQALPLSCEARSAVDWARFFGMYIKEMDFQYKLPGSDDPNKGFVGDPDGERGYIPPDSYGVHAAPVARLLRGYGLKAESYTFYDWGDLRREIAAGRPVIAWVVGHVWSNMTGQRYKTTSGAIVTVAAFEHTVIVVGYTASEVTVIDNDQRYSVPVEQFLDSWEVLERMVVIAH